MKVLLFAPHWRAAECRNEYVFMELRSFITPSLNRSTVIEFSHFLLPPLLRTLYLCVDRPRALARCAGVYLRCVLLSSIVRKFHLELTNEDDPKHRGLWNEDPAKRKGRYHIQVTSAFKNSLEFKVHPVLERESWQCT